MCNKFNYRYESYRKIGRDIAQPANEKGHSNVVVVPPNGKLGGVPFRHQPLCTQIAQLLIPRNAKSVSIHLIDYHLGLGHMGCTCIYTQCKY
jgi:hypothetical protein